MSELIAKYISLAKEHGVCTISGDYRNGNKAYSQMIKVIDKIKNSSEKDREGFYHTLKDENDSVRIWTAVTLLATFEKEALEVLRNIRIKNKDIQAFNAGMTIDCWRKGTLKNIDNWNK